jgi:hypothetical protein
MGKDLTTTIQGIVIPVAWDEDGFAVTLAVVTYREERFIVADTPVGWKLKAFLRKKVSVEGFIATDDGQRTITVLSFRPDFETENNQKAAGE